MTEAVLYYRISLDKTGERLGVERQEPESLELCKRLGFEPGRRYIDNDISATSGAVRPEFERLLSDLKREPCPVVVWHTDRLVRVTKDLERVIELGVNVHSVHAGHFDLSTPAGRAVARTLTAWATYEGEQKAIRQKTAFRQRAQMGKPWWSARPFGLELDGTERPSEAEIVRELYRDVLAGLPLYSLAQSLNGAGITTTRGRPWRPGVLRAFLLNPRNAGIRTLNGEEIGQGDWDALVSREIWEAVRIRLEDPHRRDGTGNGRRVGLLSGVVRCAECGGGVNLTSRHSRGRAYRIYVCRGGGCMTQRAELVDAFVEEAVMVRLSTPEGRAVWQAGESRVDVAALEKEALTARTGLTELAQLAGAGDLTPQQLAIASRGLKERLDAAERALADIGRGSAAERFGMTADEVLGRWSGLSTDTRRGIIEALVEELALHRRGQGKRGLEPSQVELKWR